MLAFFSILKLIFILVWTCSAIIIATIACVFMWSPRIPVFLAKHLWSPITLFLIGARVIVEGKENITRGQHYLILSNHASYADIPTLFRALPLYLRFIGKDELQKVPFIGFYMKLSGMIFIDRSNPRKAHQNILEAVEIAKTGKNVVIFPEGTTILGDDIAPFKGGFTVLAKKAKSTILPVRIRGTHKVWPSDSNFKIRKGKITITIGEPIPFEDYADLSNKEILKEFRQKIVAL